MASIWDTTIGQLIRLMGAIAIFVAQFYLWNRLFSEDEPEEETSTPYQ